MRSPGRGSRSALRAGGGEAVRSVRRAALIAAAACVLAAEGAAGREVRVPLTVEPAILREAIVRRVYVDGGGRAVFWGEPEGCSFFYLEDPQVEGLPGRIRVRSRGEARLGTDFGVGCLSPIAWGGFVEVFEEPRVEGWELRFEIVDSNLYEPSGAKSVLVGQLWDRIEESVQPRFAAVTVDLAPPFRELREFLRSVASPDRAEDARRALDTLRLVSASAGPKGVTVEAAIDVPEAPPAAPAAPEPPLTEPEIAAFTERVNQWDAFVTFVVKTLGARSLAQPTRAALLETLLEARHRIVEALERPTGHDPVRRLFLDAWQRLRPVADDVARGLPGAESVRILTFLAAGDALEALDQVGPSFGVEISADGLRRMARMISPGADDPLAYEAGVDPALREMLGFAPEGTDEVPAGIVETPLGPTPPAPAVAPAAASPAPPATGAPSPSVTVTATPGGSAPDAPPAPTPAGPTPSAGAPATPESSPPGTPLAQPPPGPTPSAAAPRPPSPTETVPEPDAAAPEAHLDGAGWWPFGSEAWAAEPPAGRSADWTGWLPGGPRTVGAYLQKARKLLDAIAVSVTGERKLAAAEAGFYRRLLAATAWQESCWRQFEERGGKVTYLRSPRASVGMMQVNERVWRGFYDVHKLRWKVAYNVRAGAEILRRYVELVEEMPGGFGPQRPDETGRAIYAAYNGGPSQLRRYLARRKAGKTGLRVVDELFAPKLAAIGPGVETKVAACIVGGAAG